MKFLILLSLAMVINCQEDTITTQIEYINDIHFMTTRERESDSPLSLTKQGLALVEYMLVGGDSLQVGAICEGGLDMTNIPVLCWPDVKNPNPQYVGISIGDAAYYFNSTYLADLTPLFMNKTDITLDPERNCSYFVDFNCGFDPDECWPDDCDNEDGSESDEDWSEWSEDGDEWSTESNWNEWGTDWNDSVIDAYFGGASAELNVPGMDSVEVHLPEMEVQADWDDIMQVLSDLWDWIFPAFDVYRR